MFEFQCECGKKIKEGKYPSVTTAYILTETKEDVYADDIVLEIEDYINAVRSGTEREWFKNCTNKYPDDVSRDTIIYDILNNSQNNHMKKIYECESCGCIYFKAGEKLTCFNPCNDKYCKVLA